MIDGRGSFLVLKEHNPEPKLKSQVKRKSEVNIIVDRLHKGYKQRESCPADQLFPSAINEPVKLKKKHKSYVKQ